jgi:hypothetical protein
LLLFTFAMCRLRNSSGRLLQALDAASHDLERAILATANGIERSNESANQFARWRTTLWWALYVAYPVGMALLAAATIKVHFVRDVMMGSANAAIVSAVSLLLVPIIGGMSLLRLFALRKAYHERKAKELATAKVGLISKIKAELPMKQVSLARFIAPSMHMTDLSALTHRLSFPFLVAGT